MRLTLGEKVVNALTTNKATIGAMASAMNMGQEAVISLWKAGGKGMSALASVFKKVPMAREVGKALGKSIRENDGKPNGTVSGHVLEYVASSVLMGSGLYKEGGAVQNNSGWGVDMMTKTFDGEWISWEMKANTSRLSKPQREGSSKYTNRKLNEAVDSYRNWKNADVNDKKFAKRILDEQKDYNDKHADRDDNFFRGLTIVQQAMWSKPKTTLKFWNER